MLDKTKEKRFDTRLKVLWTLFIIKLAFGLTTLKTTNQLNVYMFCTWIPLVVYHGIQNFRINDMLRHHYPEFAKSQFKLAGFHLMLLFHKETLEEIEDQRLRNELIFYRRLVRLIFLWMFSYILYVIALWLR